MRCAYCHDTLLESPVRTCSSCGTYLHVECWGALRRPCATLGCGGRRSRSRWSPASWGTTPARPGVSRSFVATGFLLSVLTAVPAGIGASTPYLAAFRDPSPGLGWFLLALVALASHFLVVPAGWLACQAGGLGDSRGLGARFGSALACQFIVASLLLILVVVACLALISASHSLELALVLALLGYLLLPGVACWGASRFYPGVDGEEPSPRPRTPQPAAIPSIQFANSSANASKLPPGSRLVIVSRP
jgi:hypothetical protein